MITQIINTDTNQEMTRKEHMEFVKDNRVVQDFDRRTGVLTVRLATAAENEAFEQWQEQQRLESSPEWQQKQARIAELKRILTAYTEDLAQAQMGIHIPDMGERKLRFVDAHAELRRLEGKSPR